MVDQRIIMAGFGGQGIMLMGQLLTYAGMLENLEVSWLPSYGPEMRGGTANCHVIVSDTPIGSPIIDNNATGLVVMNRPSLDKFIDDVEPGGNIFINSSLVDAKVDREDVNVYYIPCNEIAIELNNNKISNMVMLGAIISVTNCVKKESVLLALEKKLGEKKKHLVPLNEQAIDRGANETKN